MSYVTRVLQPGEAVVYTTTLHWQIYVRAVVLFLIAVGFAIASQWLSGNGRNALLAAAALALLLAISSWFRAWIRRATTELAVTDARVIYKAGLLRRHTLEMNRSKVESVDVDQTLMGRILGYGTVIVRGTGGSLEPMRNISGPLDFRSTITAG